MNEDGIGLIFRNGGCNMQFTKVVLSVSLLLFFIPSFANGQAVSPAPGLATVSGRILDSPTGTPLEDSHVWILKATGEFYKVAQTDKAGHYEVSVPKGYYYIVLGRSGYLPAVRAVFLHPGQAYHFSARLKVNMNDFIYEP